MDRNIPTSEEPSTSNETPRATGGIKLTGPLKLENVLNLLLLPPKDPEKKVPGGLKENVAFVVNNEKNVQNKKNWRKNKCLDDCGAWTDCGSPRIILVRCGEVFQQVTKNESGKYCMQKVVSGKSKPVPIDPQPDEASVVHLQRQYSAATLLPGYTRVITWLNGGGRSDIPHVAVYEYLGLYKGANPHDKSKNQTSNHLTEIVQVPVPQPTANREDIPTNTTDSMTAEYSTSIDRSLTAGGIRLRKQLNINDIMTLLLEPLKDPENEVPDGVKENIAFVVNDERNVQRRIDGKNNEFLDDCGAWTYNSSPRNILVRCGKVFRQVTKDKSGKYCVKKQVRGVNRPVPMEPQPDDICVINMQRHYSTSMLSSNYMRRITWLNSIGQEDPPHVAVYEYFASIYGFATSVDSNLTPQNALSNQGTYPGAVPHGRSKQKTSTDVQQKEPDKVQTHKTTQLAIEKCTARQPKPVAVSDISCLAKSMPDNTYQTKSVTDDIRLTDPKPLAVPDISCLPKSMPDNTCLAESVTDNIGLSDPKPVAVSDISCLAKSMPDNTCLIESVTKYRGLTDPTPVAVPDTSGLAKSMPDSTCLAESVTVDVGLTDLAKSIPNNTCLAESVTDDRGLTDPMPKEPSALMEHSTPYGGRVRKAQLDTEDILNLLLEPLNIPIEEVPVGIKENIAFVVNNEVNVLRQMKGKKIEFQDDCGAWIKGSSPTTLFVRCGEFKELKRVMKDKEGKYYTVKLIYGMPKRVVMEPQPGDADIIKMQRHYSTSKLSSSYTRRITWLNGVGQEDLPRVAVYEYLGKYPGAGPHGNCKKQTSAYVRRKGTDMEKTNETAQNSNCEYIADQTEAVLSILYLSESTANATSPDASTFITWQTESVTDNIGLNVSAPAEYNIDSYEQTAEESNINLNEPRPESDRGPNETIMTLEEPRTYLTESVTDNMGLNEPTLEESSMLTERPSVADGIALKGTLDLMNLLNLLLEPPANHEKVVPAGVKENVAFVVNNEANVLRRINGKKSKFMDDCRQWRGGSSPSTMLVRCGKVIRRVMKNEEGKYYTVKQLDKIRKPVPLDPQPDDAKVINMQRHYSTSMMSSGYVRRITWLNGIGQEDLPRVAVFEYIGKYPGIRPHGNLGKKKSSTCVRRKKKSSKMAQIANHKECITGQTESVTEIIVQTEPGVDNTGQFETESITCPTETMAGIMDPTEAVASIMDQSETPRDIMGQTDSVTDSTCPTESITEFTGSPESTPEKHKMLEVSTITPGGRVLRAPLTLKDVLYLLLEPLPDLEATVPEGIKENIAFVLNNEANKRRRINGKRSQFPDDCGSTWKDGTSPTTMLLRKGEIFQTVAKNKEGKYCTRRKVKGKCKMIPLKPQPDDATVIHMQRNYSTSKLSSRYTRRITWLNGVGQDDPPPVAVYEYLGVYPGVQQYESNDAASTYGGHKQVNMEQGYKSNDAASTYGGHKQVNMEQGYKSNDAASTYGGHKQVNMEQGYKSNDAASTYGGHKQVNMEQGYKAAESINHADIIGRTEFTVHMDANKSLQDIIMNAPEPRQKLSSSNKRLRTTEPMQELGSSNELLCAIESIQELGSSNKRPRETESMQELRSSNKRLLETEPTQELRSSNKRLRTTESMQELRSSNKRLPVTEPTQELRSSRVRFCASGGIPLIGPLDVDSMIKLLLEPQPNPEQEVPTGVKENVAFVVNDDVNVQRRTKGKSSTFSDDCHSWSYCSSSLSYFVQSGNTFRKVRKNKAGKYCTEKQIGGCREQVPMVPQPDDASVVQMQRRYTTSTLSLKYTRRITWLKSFGQRDLPAVAVYEYLGRYPGESPQSSSKSSQISTVGNCMEPGTEEIHQAVHGTNSEHINGPTDSMSNITHFRASGGIPLVGPLDVDNMIELLTEPQPNPEQEVPAGIKENVAFVVNDDVNVRRRTKGKSSTFSDDCDSWSNCSSSLSNFVQSGNTFRKVIKNKAGKYCTEKQIGGCRKQVPMVPQPDAARVVQMQRRYTTSTLSLKYMRRITWLKSFGQRDLPAVAVYEYLGRYPGESPQSSSKSSQISTVKNCMEPGTEEIHRAVHETDSEHINGPTDSMTNITHFRASGGIPLVGPLEVDSMVELLLEPPPDPEQEVPVGVKENVAFVVNDDVNVQRRTKGKSSTFSDDCHSWSYCSSSLSNFVQSGNTFRKVIKNKAGKYCTEKQIGGCRQQVPMVPQPDAARVVQMQRRYTTSTLSLKYMRRITWLKSFGQRDLPAVAVYEYLGRYPGENPQSSSKSSQISTVRNCMEPGTEEIHRAVHGTNSEHINSLTDSMTNITCSTNSSPSNDSISVSGGIKLTKTLEVDDVMALLLEPPKDMVQEVPDGVKENVAFVVNNESNIQRQITGIGNVFWDDCGAWTKCSSPKVVLVRSEKGYHQVSKDKDGKYCTEKQVRGKRISVPMEPQPDDACVINMQRRYTTSKLSSNYTRRITWLNSVGQGEIPRVAVYEYLGKYPGAGPHGNCTQQTSSYVRRKEAEKDQASKAAAKITIWAKGDNTNAINDYCKRKSGHTSEENSSGEHHGKYQKIMDAIDLDREAQLRKNKHDHSYYKGVKVKAQSLKFEKQDKSNCKD